MVLDQAGKVLPILSALLFGSSVCMACPVFADRFEASLADPLSFLSDEFDDAASLGDWQRVWSLEGWPGDQLEEFSIGGGELTMLPHTSAWFEDLRGVLAFKPVTGDFIVSTRFTASNRAESGAPNRLYSLAGLFVRGPRPITDPSQWTPGGENYVFLSAGSADQPGTFQYEVKTTENSLSTLTILDACGGACPSAPVFELLAARLEGEHFVLLRREPGSDQWQVHQRYRRSDLPETLQVGLTTYTDWNSINGPYWPSNQFAHNNTVITDGQPDLLARFQHVRFRSPRIPAELQGRDYSADYDPGDPSTVSDADLLCLLTGQSTGD
ncbi:hypothetical protein AY599_18070 [Leptolyngbya valderiana BDU 20041]|nr:hypothetical protein AY599_18070 [Leptolyngbya valderiana BDU 20041]